LGAAAAQASAVSVSPPGPKPTHRRSPPRAVPLRSRCLVTIVARSFVHSSPLGANRTPRSNAKSSRARSPGSHRPLSTLPAGVAREAEGGPPGDRPPAPRLDAPATGHLPRLLPQRALGQYLLRHAALLQLRPQFLLPLEHPGRTAQDGALGL